MKAKLRVIHRWISLCVATLWVVQALSGAYLVFHRSIDDMTLGASGRPQDAAAIGRAIASLERQPPGGQVLQYFRSGGVEGQVDLLVDRPDGRRQVVRIDGATGEVLRQSAWERPLSQVAISRQVFLLHKQLLSGAVGDWFVGLSGVLLATNLLIALRLAWPARGRWRNTLVPQPSKSPAMTALAWHRAVGLWLAPMGLLAALTGALIVWSPQLERAAGATLPPPARCASAVDGARRVEPGVAEQAARAVYPDGLVAVVTLPRDRSCYAVRLKRPGEWRRVYGTTIVYVDAASGLALKSRDALAAPTPVRMVMGLYPLHAGEWGGIATRVLALVVGIWLCATIVLGVTLWLKRRPGGKPAPRSAR
ncbi:MAG: PepSY-associated TM helix domain-containing protein [Phenylobacterium sp.]|uniref:PepSY-associated TM helix domain-containing protein n=1 Tax=Phenylobacterium sp. TaxID=1871053 RepID=UPI002732C6EB|nr:PepSY-associated TM helix domain-containing protein [Phenylobacterium sp.]MDP3746563.1 PepSY-associated TM helix domain-containing protein [Phenylobacterium sp.]